MNPESNVIPYFFFYNNNISKVQWCDWSWWHGQQSPRHGSEGCKEQSQLNFLNNGSSNPKESQLATKICINVDVV